MHDITETDLQYLRTWIGRTETAHDEIRAAPIAALAAPLDHPVAHLRPGDPVPLLWHWLFCLPLHRASELGVDGHAHLGAFFPPVPLPRRMYAGGSVDVRRPPRIGEAVSRVSRIADVSLKAGRTGALVFVTIHHDFSVGGDLLVSDRQDLVYRDEPRPGEPAAPVRIAQDAAAWTQEIRPDEVLLFRYSALTFNGHRIHYDRPFAVDQGYAGLVVHGPLLATLLADLVGRHLPDATVSRFSFRALRALFVGAPFFVCGSLSEDGQTVRLWVRASDGSLAMEATAELQIAD
jgi:3-methylfumaryl-CoA hydratase